MKPWHIWLACGAAAVLLLWLMFGRGSRNGAHAIHGSYESHVSRPQIQPPIGAAILKEYADPATKPEHDLALMSHALDNFSLLVKGDNPLPLGANEDIAVALRGKNKARLRFLPDDSPVFDSQGRLIDRWGSPLYFHANARDRLDIRSAGPDKQMWTADDLHRRHDGSFLRGDDLHAASLFDEAAAGRR